MNGQETVKVAARFLVDSYEFWVGQGKTPQEARENALREVAELRHDPFSPRGKELDRYALNVFVAMAGGVL